MARYLSPSQHFHACLSHSPSASVEPLRGYNIPGDNLYDGAKRLIDEKADFYEQAFKNYALNQEKLSAGAWAQTHWTALKTGTPHTHESAPLPFYVMFNPKSLWVAISVLFLGPVGLPLSFYELSRSYGKWKKLHENFHNTSPNIYSFLKARQDLLTLEKEAFNRDLSIQELAEANQVKEVIYQGYQFLNDLLPTLDAALLFLAYQKGATVFHFLSPSLRPRQKAQGWVNSLFNKAVGGIVLHLAFQSTVFDTLQKKSFKLDKSHEEKARCLQKFFGLCHYSNQCLKPDNSDKSRAFKLQKLDNKDKSITEYLKNSRNEEIMFVIYEGLCKELKKKVEEWNANPGNPLYISSNVANHLMRRLPHSDFQRHCLSVPLKNLKNGELHYLAAAKLELGTSFPQLMQDFGKISKYRKQLREIERGFQLISQWRLMCADLHNGSTNASDEYCLDISLKLANRFAQHFQEFKKKVHNTDKPDANKHKKNQNKKIKNSYANTPGESYSLTTDYQESQNKDNFLSSFLKNQNKHRSPFAAIARGGFPIPDIISSFSEGEKDSDGFKSDSESTASENSSLADEYLEDSDGFDTPSEYSPLADEPPKDTTQYYESHDGGPRYDAVFS